MFIVLSYMAEPLREFTRFDLAGWLHTEMVYPSTEDGHPSEY